MRIQNGKDTVIRRFTGSPDDYVRMMMYVGSLSEEEFNNSILSAVGTSDYETRETAENWIEEVYFSSYIIRKQLSLK